MNLGLAREDTHTGKAGGRWPSHDCVWNTHGRKADPTQQRTGLVTEGLKIEKAMVVPLPAYPGSIWWPHRERAPGLEI